MTNFQFKLALVLICVYGVLSITVIFLKHAPKVSVVQFSTSSTPSLLQLTNQERSLNLEAPLREDSVLDAAAGARATALCSASFSHDGWQESFSASSYNHIGENIARNYPDANSTNIALMASKEHRDNILDTKFEDIGIASGNCSKESPDGTQAVTVELFGGYN